MPVENLSEAEPFDPEVYRAYIDRFYREDLHGNGTVADWSFAVAHGICMIGSEIDPTGGARRQLVAALAFAPDGYPLMAVLQRFRASVKAHAQHRELTPVPALRAAPPHIVNRMISSTPEHDHYLMAIVREAARLRGER